MKERIYFDGAANMAPYKAVLDVLQNIYTSKINNPSSLHHEGVMASEMLEKARYDIAKLIGCDADEIFFVSGASEAIAWVAKMRTLVVHPTSHHAVMEAKQDCNPKLIKKPVIAIPYYDSETGTKNELTEFADKDIFLDLTASIGKERINLHEMPRVKYACFSAHKFGGVLGAGVLYIKRNVQKYIQPLIWGSQEHNYRGGTENYPAIVAMAEEYIKGGKSTKYRELAKNEITPYYVCEAAKQGDVVAKKIFEIIGTYIGIGLSSVVNLLNPEKIVIGGVYMRSSALLIPSMQRVLNAQALNESLQVCEIVPAKLSENIGDIAALSLASM